MPEYCARRQPTRQLSWLDAALAVQFFRYTAWVPGRCSFRPATSVELRHGWPLVKRVGRQRAAHIARRNNRAVACRARSANHQPRGCNDSRHRSGRNNNNNNSSDNNNAAHVRVVYFLVSWVGYDADWMWLPESDLACSSMFRQYLRNTAAADKRLFQVDACDNTQAASAHFEVAAIHGYFIDREGNYWYLLSWAGYKAGWQLVKECDCSCYEVIRAINRRADRATHPWHSNQDELEMWDWCPLLFCLFVLFYFVFVCFLVCFLLLLYLFVF